MADRRLGVLVLVLLASGCLSAGCTASTPLCDAAAPLLTQGQVASAADLYARASLADEGSCANTGLERAGQAFGDAYRDVARGVAAEAAGDVVAAGGLYDSALRIDADNQAAAQGLVRLGRSPTRVETPIVVTPTPVVLPVWGWRDVVLIVLGVLTVLACLAVLTLGLAFWRRSGRDVSTTDGGTGSADGALSADDGLEKAFTGLGDVRDGLARLVLDGDRSRLDVVRLLAVATEGDDGVVEAPSDTDDPRVWLGCSPPSSSAPGSTAPDDRMPADQLVIAIATTSPTGARLDVREWRVEADRLDISTVVGCPAAETALDAWAVQPHEDEAADEFRRVLGVAVLDRRGTRALPLPDPEPRLMSIPELEFRAALSGVAFLCFSCGVGDARRVNVYTRVSSSAAGLFADVPQLPSLVLRRDSAAVAELHELLSEALVDEIVDHLVGTGRQSHEPGVHESSGEAAF